MLQIRLPARVLLCTTSCSAPCANGTQVCFNSHCWSVAQHQSAGVFPVGLSRVPSFPRNVALFY